MRERLFFIWDIIWKAEVIGKATTSAPMIVAAFFAAVELLGWLPEAAPVWWAYLSVGALVSILLGLWEIGSLAHNLAQEREPKLELSAPRLAPVWTAQKGLRRYEIEITNKSYGSITGCSVKEAKFGKPGTVRTGLNRPFIQSKDVFASPHHSFAKVFDLPGYDSQEKVVIAEYQDGKPTVMMLYATDPGAPTLNIIPKQFFPHELTIMVTADNLPQAIMRDYEIGFDSTGDFYMKPLVCDIGDSFKRF